MNIFVLNEWLHENRLDRNEVVALLKIADRLRALRHTVDLSAGHAPPVPASEAWEIATLALEVFLPQLAGTIRKASEETPRFLEAGRQGQEPDRPFTYHGDATTSPFVSCDYRGRPVDMLDVAHELAHVTQIAASRGAPMPPVQREVCAFLGEAALIRWAGMHRPTLVRALKSAWHASDTLYLIRDADLLSRALHAESPSYDYRWNYPVARLMASAFLRDACQNDRTALFCAGPAAPAILARFPVLPFPAALPPLPAAAGGPADAYRHAGAIALLDMQADQGEGGDSLGKRHADLLDCMKTRSVFIALNDDGEPAGYATWEPLAAAPAQSGGRCRAFPGAEDVLSRSLRLHLPEVARRADRHEPEAAANV